LKSALPYDPRFIPPIIADLDKLAYADPTTSQKYKGLGRSPEDEFEILLWLAFRMLGYEVKELGHSTAERDPDGIAFARRDHYAVVFDAKIRSGGYSIGTDDRALTEYVDKYSPELERQGIDSLYLSIISSYFVGENDRRIVAIRKETSVKNVTLLKASLLLRMIGLKLKGAIPSLGVLEAVFLRPQEISSEDIDRELG
jgi:hypothetical protein